MKILSVAKPLVLSALGLVIVSQYAFADTANGLTTQLDKKYEYIYKTSEYTPCDRKERKALIDRKERKSVLSNHSCMRNNCEFSVITNDNSNDKFTLVARKGAENCARYDISATQLEQKISYEGKVRFDSVFLKTLGVENPEQLKIFDLGDNIKEETTHGRVTGKGKINGEFVIDINYDGAVSEDMISIYGQDVGLHY